jgi:hypothetical protein
MTCQTIDIEEERGQLDLLPRTVCLPRVRLVERPAETAAAEPLETPLRRSSLDTLLVIHGLQVRLVVTTTRSIARALCLPDTEHATRNLERTLRALESRKVLAVIESLKKARGRPAIVWGVTELGRAELQLDHLRAKAEHAHRVERHARRKVRTRREE